jgi:hypothetical protein
MGRELRADEARLIVDPNLVLISGQEVLLDIGGRRSGP